MKEYLALIKWLFRDAFRHFPRLAGLAVFLQFSVALFQVLVGIFVVRIFQQGEAADSATQSGLLGVFGDSSLVVPLAIAVGLFFAVSALINYFAEFILTRMQRRYEEFNSVTLLKKINNLTAAQFAVAPIALDRIIITKSVNAYSRFSAIAQRLLLRCVVPAAVMIGALIYLVSSDIWILWPLAIFAVIAIIPFRYVNLKAIEISQNFEAAATRANQAKITAIDSIDRVSAKGEDGGFESAVKTGPNSDFMDLYELRLNIAKLSSTFSALVAAIALAVLFVFMSNRVGDGKADWSDFIFVFIALQFAFSAAQRVAAMITSLNRFHAPLETVQTLLAWKPPASGETRRDNAKFNIEVNCSAAHTKRKSFSVGSGRKRFLVSPERMGRFAIYRYLRDAEISTDDAFDADQRPLLLMAGGAKERGSTRQQIDKVEFLSMLNKVLPTKLKKDDPVIDLAFQDDARIACFVTDLIAAAEMQNQFVFVDQLGLNRLPVDVVVPLLGLFDKSDLTLFGFKTVQLGRVWNIDEFILYNGQAIASVLDLKEFTEMHAMLPELVQPPDLESVEGKPADETAGIELL